MRNGRGLCPTLHITVSVAARARSDVTRNGKCAAHMSCISFSAGFKDVPSKPTPPRILSTTYDAIAKRARRRAYNVHDVGCDCPYK